MNKHTAYDLAQMQSLPLEAKLRMTERRIREKQAPALLDFTLELLGELLDEPCSYSFDGNGLDEYMFEHCGEWCNENCGKISAAECWRKYIETRFKEEE